MAGSPRPSSVPAVGMGMAEPPATVLLCTREPKLVGKSRWVGPAECMEVLGEGCLPG